MCYLQDSPVTEPPDSPFTQCLSQIVLNWRGMLLCFFCKCHLSNKSIMSLYFCLCKISTAYRAAVKIHIRHHCVFVFLQQRKHFLQIWTMNIYWTRKCHELKTVQCYKTWFAQKTGETNCCQNKVVMQTCPKTTIPLRKQCGGGKKVKLNIFHLSIWFF